jgi:hypothetical protein
MPEFTHEEIAIAAYFIWLNNSLYGINEAGQAVANWYAAEQQLRQTAQDAGVAWMIFGEHGHYRASANMPAQLIDILTSNVAKAGWVIDRVYFAPDSNGYLVVHNGTFTAFQNFPADVTTAISGLQANGVTFNHLSWISPGIWAVFGIGGPTYYSLGPDAPPALAAFLEPWSLEGGGGGGLDVIPENAVFAPDGEWLVALFDVMEQTPPWYQSSPGFPADVMAAIQKLPTNVDDQPGHANVGVQSLVFNPTGGWAMVDTAGHFHQSGAPADLLAAVSQFQKASIALQDVAMIALQTATVSD